MKINYHLTRLLLLTTCIMLASCKTLNKDVTYNQMISKASVEAKSLTKNYEYKSCEQGIKQFGDVRINCNIWGKSKVKKGTPELCVYKKGNYWGWEWEVPNSARGVIGYPALMVGKGPWSGHKKIANFPQKITNIKKLNVSYDFETHVKHRKYNLAFDIWLTDKELNTSAKNITTEIMIWEDYFDFSSYGKVVDKISTPFGKYKVYEGYLDNPKYNQDWTYLAFVRENPRNSGDVDIKYFLDYLISHNKISKENYMASFELGNEIGNSSGLTLVKKFDWELVLN